MITEGRPEDRVGEYGGLRERKKLATRRALRAAATRLVFEHGLDKLTVDAICAEVGVSARTFFNYFSTKEEALLGDPLTLPPAETVKRLLGEHPDDILSGVNAVMRHVVEKIPNDPSEIQQRMRLTREYPQLLPLMHTRFSAFERSLAESIADYAGVDIDKDFYPEVVAGVAMSAIRVAMHRWKANFTIGNYEQHLDEVFEVLRTRL